ncbi:MAG TPA: hypothetical protein VFT99_14520, partial [Roseiflexaceae bacterium]|nr:hypothetical protein [Roseiflexaceae bacterium]
AVLVAGFGQHATGLFATPRAADASYKAFLPFVVGAGQATGNPGNPGNPGDPGDPTPQPPVKAGFFPLDTWLTYSAGTTVDANGGMHMVMFLSDEKHDDQPLNSPALYSYCPGPASACVDPNAWSEPVQFSEGVNEVQVLVTHSGQPRLLVRRHNNRFNDYEYYACDANCTQAGQWSGISVTEDTGTGMNDFSHGNHSFALDANNRPRFVYGNGWGNGQPDGIYYAWCDAADCTAQGSWQRTRAFVGEQYVTTAGEGASLAFAGDKPRVVINRTLTGIPADLLYLSCDADCDQTESWASMVVAPPANKAWKSWDLAINAAGHPRMALYEPPSIDIVVGGTLYYAWCDAENCTDAGAWQRVVVARGEGLNADLVIDGQGRTHMVYDAGSRGVLGELRCSANCGDPNAWQRRILETNEQLKADFEPASPLSCTQQDNLWLDALPSAAVGPNGNLVVAYDTKYVGQCFYYDPADPTHKVYTRVERIWWAVRWATFPG